MLVRGTRRLASGFAIALVLLTLFMVYYGPNMSDVPPATPPGKPPIVVKPDPVDKVPAKPLPTTTTPSGFQRVPRPGGVTDYVKKTHRELSSLTTSDGGYFDVDYSPWPAYNPNFTPHPTKNDTWITVAQYHKNATENQVWFTQVICEAQFMGNSLHCIHPPWIVPIPPTWTDACTGDIAHFNMNIGPHDARVFYGPERPYILYGTQASYACFGQYFQDFTLVSDWPGAWPGKFKRPTEIMKPPPHKYSKVEKNWFLFWDSEGELFIHHDIAPTRIFGKMEDDGTIEKDANQLIATEEAACLESLMPYAKPTYEESIHQATNSLAVTMCKRTDPSCIPSERNTFVFHIFHWKSFYEFHGLYEPYVHMFSQYAPYRTYGVSSKPLWFRGRRLPGTWREEGLNGWNQTEMVYTTSIAWKEHGMKYHGYLDDILLIGFGIEDKESGGLDIRAADLFKDIVTCDGSPVNV
ncbi:hypothetical protein AMS68_003862 [Peltaster fructicola]|uniref:EH domain-containing protein n=1 Tax=Peltaster fructicola TaxID=286661 RepID=A0A6H0XUL6_9PEZI|nr:hypothetical protein AMS68_003862 [Peltaster fructicola]